MSFAALSLAVTLSAANAGALRLDLPAAYLAPAASPGTLLALADDLAAGAAGAQDRQVRSAPVSDVQTTIFGLPKNVGPVDRVLRAVAAAALAGVGAYGLITGDIGKTTSGVLLGVSAVPASTAATGYCPAYHLFGITETF